MKKEQLLFRNLLRVFPMKQSFIAGLLLALFLGSSAINVSAEVLSLSLERAIEIALSDNPLIRIADKEIERVDYSHRMALNHLLPSIDIDGNYTRNFKKPVIYFPPEFGMSGGVEIGFDNSYTAGLNASLPIFSYTIFQNIKLSKHDVEIALESAKASRINMVAEVRKAYYGLLLANDSYDVMKRSMQNAEDNLTDVRRMFDQGMVAEYDLIRSEVQVRNIKPAVVQAENGVRMAELMVRVLLGLNQDIMIEVEDELETYSDKHILLNEDRNTDIEGNFDLRRLGLEIERLQTQYKVVRSQRYPMLAAFGSFQYMTQANDFKFKNYPWANPIMAGFQLQIPIFSGFNIRNQERQISLGIEQMKMQLEYLDLNVNMQLQNAFNKMDAAYEQIESNKQGVSQAERGYSIAQTRYQTGSATYLELNDAEIALTQAKLNFNNALFEYLAAEAEYYQIIGDDNL